MIEFILIKYKNLLSTGNYWTEVKLNKNQNTLVVGTNGSGKSTILDALCFVLFGKPFRAINKPSLVNSINKKGLLVEVDFNSNGTVYKIIRGIKPNVFEIYQDGNLLNQDASVKDYQEVLEKYILKFNYKSFTQIVILGSASFTPFMQLSTADRRTIIEDLLDINIFSVMNTIVKDKVSNNKDLINVKKHSIQMLEQKYDIHKKFLDNLRQDNDFKIKEYESEVIRSNDIIIKLNGEVEELNKIFDDIQNKINSYSGSEVKVKEYVRTEATVESKLSNLKKECSFFERNDTCSVCKQDIDQSFKLSKIESLKSDIIEIEGRLVKLEEMISKEQKVVDFIKKKQLDLQKIQVKVSSNLATITEKNKYIGRINNQINELKNKGSVNREDIDLLDSLKIQLDDENEELRVLIDDKVYYDLAVSLLKDSGIKTKIVKQYLPIINKLVNKYLSTLNFFVNFNLDESFKETIKSRHRDDFTYNNFSEGEKQRIDMSLMLTWRAVAKIKNSTNTNLLFLDEIFDSSLDAGGTEYLMTILHTLEDVNLFVISHKVDILQDKFDNVIEFQKVKNFSKIKK